MRGDHSAATATGTCSASLVSGFDGIASATGSYSTASVTGVGGISAATGHCSFAETNSPTGIAVAWGYRAKAKGVLGSYLILAEWHIDETSSASLTGVKMVQVDGEQIKADTWYILENGEVKEWTEDDD